MADKNPQKQVIDELKDVESVLVTVNTNPTVDELSAALGLTLLLNKTGKHATAVFSGVIPPAIMFLEPEKTFENTTNSLRDFIIALDKEKADHLRYKVDGDMVKIFITPYRTTISDEDLEFSQGDYNVEMVIALGVRDADDLDRALVDHGKIMHDATIASLSAGSEASDLGSLNWHDSEVSGYSEMAVAIADGLKEGKNLIDEQIANALLTGIVAATERFSNQRTTSNSMTVAAQLMAAGANQQLIATQLEEADEIPQAAPARAQQPADILPAPVPQTKDRQAADGTMQISHEKRGTLEEVSAQTEHEQQTEAEQRATQALANETSNHHILDDFVAHGSQGAAGATLATLSEGLDADHEPEDIFAPQPAGPTASLPTPRGPGQPLPMDQFEPSMGGTLNATTEEAAAAKLREELSDRNKQILSHDRSQFVGNPPASLPAINSFTDASQPAQPTAMINNDDGYATARAATITPPDDDAMMPQYETTGPTLAEIDAQNRQPHDEARAAIDDALRGGPSTADQQASVASAQPTLADAVPPVIPEGAPVEYAPAPDVPLMPQELMYDATTTQVAMPPQAPAPMMPESTVTNELPPLPPMPDFSTLPPLPGDTSQTALPPMPSLGQSFAPPTASSAELNAAFPPIPPAPGTVPPSNDPNQFQIPPAA